MHKGFKCLDLSEGRVYISRDVTFDERVFPFAELHSNAGARLRAEISLLPENLLNSSSTFGDATILDHTVSTPNPVASSTRDSGDTGENSDQIAVQTREIRRYFMRPDGDKMGTENHVGSASSADSSGGVAGESPLGSAPTAPAASTVPHSAAQSGAGETNSGTASSTTSGTTDIDTGGSSVLPTSTVQGG